MREIVFRSLAGLASLLFLVGTVLMAREEFNLSVVLMGGIGLLFAAYAALGEYKIRGVLKLIGAKDNSSQRRGGGRLGG